METNNTKRKTCFVIIGFGKKTSYANGKVRSLDLDETYTYLIKPVFDALDIDCYRAIDKNLNASIDKIMLQEIKNADLVIADISTLNANVMWELGVRHALREHHTIIISEKEQMTSVPFDINHFVIHTYAHSEEGIPFKEVDRFRSSLTELVKGILALDKPESDSPVYTFLKDEMAELLAKPQVNNEGEESFTGIIEKAEKAKSAKDYDTALALFERAKDLAQKNMTFKDNLPFIKSRLALCTYKAAKPNEMDALLKAWTILEELQPTSTQDPEILGISGAINKRLNELNNDISYLDTSIWFYEKGFQLKQDYYNGINAAYMIYKKTAALKQKGDEDWEDCKLKGDYIRNTVLEIAKGLESQPDFNKREDAIWVLLTIAEAYNTKKNNDKMLEYEKKAEDLAKERGDTFALGSYHEQKERIKTVFSIINS